LNGEKINQLITNRTKLALDGVFITEPNAKWSASNTDIMYYKLIQMGRGLKMINADSKIYHIIDKDYFQGGLLIALWGRVSTLIDDKLIHKNRLGNWIAYKMTNEDKIIRVILIYHVP